MLPAIFGENLFDEMFDDMMRPMHSMEKALYGKHARAIMKTDVRETDNSYEVDIDLPGFKKDEVNVQLEDGYLTVSAAKGLDKDEKKKGRYIGRSVTPASAAAASMSASPCSPRMCTPNLRMVF